MNSGGKLELKNELASRAAELRSGIRDACFVVVLGRRLSRTQIEGGGEGVGEEKKRRARKKPTHQHSTAPPWKPTKSFSCSSCRAVGCLSVVFAHFSSPGKEFSPSSAMHLTLKSFPAVTRV